MRRPFLLVILAAACSRPGSDDNAFGWNAQLPPGATVHLRDGAGDITVRQSATPNARVVGAKHWRRGRASDVSFVVTQKGNDYYMCAMWRNSGRCGASGYRGRNTSSFLSMFSLFHRTTDAEADIIAELPANVTIDARTTNGSIDITGLRAGVVGHAVNGTVRADNVSGALDLQTTNGDVRVSLDSVGASDPIRLTTTNGSVHAELPGNLDGLYDLSVVNGVVHSDIPLPSSNTRGVVRRLGGQIGTSSRQVKMRSVNGMVTVTQRGAPAPAAP